MQLAVIGLGRQISSICEGVRRVEPEARIVAVADPDRASANGYLAKIQPHAPPPRWYADADQMLREMRDIDGVLIGTPCYLHAPMAVKVARSGLPLFLEKPVAITWAQLKSLAQAFQGREGSVAVSFPLRWTPLFQEVLKIVRGGRLGTINQIQAINNVPYGGVYYSYWYRNYDYSGGLWLQKATHDFDYLTLLMDAEPRTVGAVMTQRVFGGGKPHDLRCGGCDQAGTCMESPQNLVRRGDDGGVSPPDEPNKDHLCVFSREIFNEDAGSAVITYSNGAHVCYTQNFVTRRSAARRGAIITGYKATLEFDWYTYRIRIVEHHRDQVDEITIKNTSNHGGGDEAMATNFVNIIRGIPVDGLGLSDGLLSVATCLAARKSSHTGTFQPIPAVDEIPHLTMEEDTFPAFVRL